MGIPDYAEKCECGHACSNHEHWEEECEVPDCPCKKFVGTGVHTDVWPKEIKKKTKINCYRVLWCLSIASLALPVMAIGFCYTIIKQSWETGKTIPDFIQELIRLED